MWTDRCDADSTLCITLQLFQTRVLYCEMISNLELFIQKFNNLVNSSALRQHSHIKLVQSELSQVFNWSVPRGVQWNRFLVWWHTFQVRNFFIYNSSQHSSLFKTAQHSLESIPKRSPALKLILSLISVSSIINSCSWTQKSKNWQTFLFVYFF